MDTIYTTILIGFVASLVLSPIFIPLLRRLKFGQQIRGEGPQSHYQKSGTPTMGGIIFLLAALISLIFIAPWNADLLILVFITIGTGMLGFLDDFNKVVKKQSLGLKARHKIIGQLLIVIVFSVYLHMTNHATDLIIPFTNIGIELGLGYYILLVFLMLGTTNAVNITDGLDGLATGVVVICLTAFVMIAHMSGLIGAAVFGSALIGACAGFLIFNLHPAKVFMGDVGSLALGSALAGIAVITKAELALVIVGFALVIETLSVICQVLYYQVTGNRILLMSPLHHHFELKGWSEWKVVLFFWFITLVSAGIGVVSVF